MGRYGGHRIRAVAEPSVRHTLRMPPITTSSTEHLLAMHEVSDIGFDPPRAFSP